MWLGEFHSRTSPELGSFHPRILSTHLASNLHSPNPCLWGRCEGVPHYRTGHSARAWLLDLGGAGRLHGPPGLSLFNLPVS